MTRSEMIEHILERLDRDGQAIQAAWSTPGDGTRTRHCIIDGLLPDAVALKIFDAFPKNGEGFHTRKSFREHKRTSANLDQLPTILADVTYALQNESVIARFSELTGIVDMLPDPHLYAGGLSMMFNSEFLNPHIDNSHEQTKTKYRRLNLLYYVTPDWREEYGGNLELWDDDVSEPVTLMAAFNRLILMETNQETWHSVSPVLFKGPRCCVSNYYFTDASPTGEIYYHVTSFTGRPEQKLRRAFGLVDNAARSVARKLGASRKSDQGYTGDLATGGTTENA